MRRKFSLQIIQNLITFLWSSDTYSSATKIQWYSAKLFWFVFFSKVNLHDLTVMRQTGFVQQQLLQSETTRKFLFFSFVSHNLILDESLYSFICYWIISEHSDTATYPASSDKSWLMSSEKNKSWKDRSDAIFGEPR